ncbi:MAG: site-2 protease family protein [Actinobacteria bacterium]|nr:site-2 protease family protein [Actinomycetota bacterium]
MRILGFPVQIRPGFVLFMLLIVVVNGQPMGSWLAGSVTLFTLVHELGHAVAARRTGATARISLDFLAGYASFTPTRALTRGERASIALAGPGIQIVLGMAALMVMGVNPLSPDDYASDYSSLAIWWAGPMIGLFNLIPVLPLDGGTIAGEIIDIFKPGRGRAIMARISPVATALAFVFMVLVEDLRPLAAFAAILLVLQMQMVSSRTPVRRGHSDAEDQAWRSGRPGVLVPPQVLSPWWEAHQLVNSGREEAAVAVVLDDLAGRRAGQWWPPHAATPAQLEPVVQRVVVRLPEPSPSDRTHSAAVLVDVLRRTGRPDVAAHYGSRVFALSRSGQVAILVARCSAALGDVENAAQWLTVAARSDAEPTLLLSTLVSAPEFARLRERPEIVDLIRALNSAG